MSAREMFKEIEVENDGKTDLYRVRKMDAFTGTALLKVLLAKFLPAVQMAEKYYNDRIAELEGSPTQDQQESVNKEMIQMLIKVAPPLLEDLSEDELKSLMVRALQFTDKKLKSGWVQVVDKSKNFAVDEVEFDLALCLNLCIQCIMFNCSGFFGENGLNLPSARRSSLPQKQ